MTNAEREAIIEDVCADALRQADELRGLADRLEAIRRTKAGDGLREIVGNIYEWVHINFAKGG